MILFPLDTETHPIKPGLQAPPLVCAQWQTPGRAPEISTSPLERLRVALEGGTERLVLHNAAFDMAVLGATWPDLISAIFRAYAEDRIACTSIREKLTRIAEGTSWRYPRNSLVDLADRYKIPHVYHVSSTGEKEEYWRTRYETLKGIPVSNWPPEAVRYAEEDPRVTLLVYEAQEAAFQARGFLRDEYRQARAAFWLYLMTCRGLSVDQRHAKRFRQQVEAEAVTLRADLTAAALVRPDGSRDTKLAKRRMVEVRDRLKLPIPVTKKGKEIQKENDTRDIVSEIRAAIALGPLPLRPTKEDKAARKSAEYIGTDADACKETQDDLLVAYARFGSVKNLRSRVARLQAAGDLPIQTRFSPIMETGRTSSSKGDQRPGQPIMSYGDQIQNLNREPGLRECYVPREGYVLISVDWAAAELHTLAQTCILMGLDSNLARVLNSGQDVHMWFGAQMKGWTYDWAQEARKGKHGAEASKAAKDARQMSKAANFGFPGGLGIEKFRLFALKTYGVFLSEEEAKGLRRLWFAAFPEMLQYFERINDLIESKQPLLHFTSERLRGALTYCSACNSGFQGRCADMAKDAGFVLARACYVPGADPDLWGSYPVNFIHDEFIAEVPEEKAHEGATAIVRIMEEAGRRWCPDVPVRAEPAISRRWRKKAEPAYSPLDGRLIPWEDREVDPKEAEVLAECAGDLIRANWINGREYQ